LKNVNNKIYNCHSEKISLAYNNQYFSKVIKIEPLQMLKKIEIKDKNLLTILEDQLNHGRNLASLKSQVHYEEVENC
jgi:hypothetical protein